MDELGRGVMRMFDQTLTFGKVLLSILLLVLLGLLWFLAGMGWNEQHPATYWCLLGSMTLLGLGMALMLLAGEQGTWAARRLMHSMFFIGALALLAFLLYTAAYRSA
ncbi:MAG: hypothetical protein WCI89_00220 [bacterium]